MKYLRGGHSFRSREYKKGDYIAREGDIGKEAFLITSGKIEISKTENEIKTVFAELSEGAVIGEMSVITNSPRSADICCLTGVKVNVITEKTVNDELKNISPWMKKIVTSLSDKLQKTNEKI
ncbi:MAG: cyclic nucleotide-binding domain-containing protein [Verrucomicrobiota bacterium]|nr:cyclic nucleotide-binding domain-containing protein [Verrucomicrobiota bacterium]